MTKTLADVQAKESVTVNYEYNSNVFDLGPGNTANISPAQRGDSLYSAAGTLLVDDLWAHQKLFLDLTGTEYRYDRFTELNRTEYNLNGGANLKLGTDVDGKVAVSRVRTLVDPLELIPGSQTNLELPTRTQQREDAQIGFLITPDWRVEGSAYQSSVAEPLTDAPNLKLSENFGQAALKFIGLKGLTSGLSLGYLSGNFSGGIANANPSYAQTNADFVASYRSSGRSTISGEVGYSKRTSATGDDKTSGVTGNVDFNSQLTTKTSVNLGLSRQISSYIVSTASEVDTIGRFTVSWQATYKVGLVLGYTLTHRNLPPANMTADIDERDRLQFTSLNVDYEFRRWLAIKPYFNLQTRSSNVVGADFNVSRFGVNFIFQSLK